MVKIAACPLGAEIRYQRRLAGLSQKEVAARVGVTGAQLHRYEVGATSVTTSRLVDIAKAIGVRPDVFIQAATRAPQQTAPINPGAGAVGDVAELLEMFAAIKDPAQRDALLAVARMISSTFPPSVPASVSVMHG